MASSTLAESYSTTEVAERLGVNISKIGEWIRGGELRAINVAKSTRGNRPRYRIPAESLADFELARSVVPPPPVPRTRHRRQDATPDYLSGKH